jgi:hypothetical protein
MTMLTAAETDATRYRGIHPQDVVRVVLGVLPDVVAPVFQQGVGFRATHQGQDYGGAEVWGSADLLNDLLAGRNGDGGADGLPGWGGQIGQYARVGRQANAGVVERI